MYDYNLYDVRLANDPNHVVTLTEKQFKNVLRRDMINSGLDLDTYMSLIDPDWPI